MLEEEEGKRPDFATLKEWLWGKPCSQPETRPSNASTEASIEPPDPYLSIVSVSQEPIHPSTSLSRADPSLIESLNSHFDFPQFAYLVQSQGPYRLVAGVTLTLKCQFCGTNYSASFSKGVSFSP